MPSVYVRHEILALGHTTEGIAAKAKVGALCILGFVSGVVLRVVYVGFVVARGGVNGIVNVGLGWMVVRDEGGVDSGMSRSVRRRG